MLTQRRAVGIRRSSGRSDSLPLLLLLLLLPPPPSPPLPPLLPLLPLLLPLLLLPLLLPPLLPPLLLPLLMSWPQLLVTLCLSIVVMFVHTPMALYPECFP